MPRADALISYGPHFGLSRTMWTPFDGVVLWRRLGRLHYGAVAFAAASSAFAAADIAASAAAFTASTVDELNPSDQFPVDVSVTNTGDATLINCVVTDAASPAGHGDDLSFEPH